MKGNEKDIFDCTGGSTDNRAMRYTCTGKGARWTIRKIHEHKLLTNARSIKVLECGSWDGSQWGGVRGMFPRIIAEYTGMDCHEGANVDMVSVIHEWHERENGWYDVIISLEHFEHDPYWKQSLKRMVELLRVNGSMIIRAAGKGRGPHYQKCTPGGQEYYGNVEFLPFVTEAFRLAEWLFFEYEYDIGSKDCLFFFGRKREEIG